MKERNLFKGVQITFEGKLIDNTEINKLFDKDGFRQHMYPPFETSVEKVERAILPFMVLNSMKFEREFTTVNGNIHTMYISGNYIGVVMRDVLEQLLRDGLLSSVVYGSMKTDAKFYPSKNQY